MKETYKYVGVTLTFSERYDYLFKRSSVNIASKRLLPARERKKSSLIKKQVKYFRESNPTENLIDCSLPDS